MPSVCLATPRGTPRGTPNGSGRVGVMPRMNPTPRGSGKKGQNPTRPDPFGSLILTPKKRTDLATKILTEYHKNLKVFFRIEADKLLKHWPYDLKIKLEFKK